MAQGKKDMLEAFLSTSEAAKSMWKSISLKIAALTHKCRVGGTIAFPLPIRPSAGAFYALPCLHYPAIFDSRFLVVAFWIAGTVYALPCVPYLAIVDSPFLVVSFWIAGAFYTPLCLHRVSGDSFSLLCSQVHERFTTCLLFILYLGNRRLLLSSGHFLPKCRSVLRPPSHGVSGNR